MGARSVAARDERRAFCLDRFQCGFDVLAFDPGRIALWPDQHEVVVHHIKPLHAESLGEEFFFLRFSMDEDHVGIATPSGVERLAGALRNHLYFNPGLGLEDRQQIAEQPGVLRRGGRGHNDRAILGAGNCEIDRSGD